jgi:hypothetical protein
VSTAAPPVPVDCSLCGAPPPLHAAAATTSATAGRASRARFWILNIVVLSLARLLTNCIAVLDQFAQRQPYLHHEPGMAKALVEETLRYDGPAKNLCRQTTAEVTINGVTIPADSRVTV